MIKSALLLAATIIATPAAAAETILWKTIGPWSVIVDTTTGSSCYMTTGYPGGLLLRFGQNRARKTFDIVLSNPDWKSLEMGKEYRLKLWFDRQNWGGPAVVGKFSTGAKYLRMVLKLDSANVEVGRLALRIAKAHVLRVTWGRITIANVKLNGSYAAMRELFRCVKSLRKLVPPPSVSKDPFLGTRARVDPFREGI